MDSVSQDCFCFTVGKVLVLLILNGFGPKVDEDSIGGGIEPSDIDGSSLKGSPVS